MQDINGLKAQANADAKRGYHPDNFVGQMRMAHLFAAMHTRREDKTEAILPIHCRKAEFLDQEPLMYAGEWFYWDGTRWAVDLEDHRARLAVYDMLGKFIDDAHRQPPDVTKELLKDAAKCESATGVAGLLTLAAPLMRVDQKLLDANAYEINTPTGTVNLKTGSMGDHDPAQRHTKITGVGYDKDAECPRWLAFLNTTFDGDQSLIDYMQRVAGYSAIGEVTHHILLFLFGVGANGKSVITEVLRTILGDYAVVATGHFLLANQKGHESEITTLVGARMVICSEVNEDSKFDEAKVKALTGGDALDGRYLYSKKRFTFEPSHTLWLAGNHQPNVATGGPSIWRRLRLLPFEHVVPEDKRNERLAHELVEEEGPAILAWIVKGAKLVAEDGLRDPAKVLTATKEYAESEDAIGQFIEECVIDVRQGQTGRELSGVAWSRYRDWCDGRGLEWKNGSRFSREMTRRGFKVEQSNGKRYIVGITLRPDEDSRTADGWVKR